jgi:DNA-directed RNA polymerase specialized sigma24 family protein
VQETLLRAWRHPESLDPRRGSVRSWLFTTARNLAIDAWRRRSTRVGEVFTDDLPEPPDVIDEARPTGKCLWSASTRDGRWPRRRPAWACHRGP